MSKDELELAIAKLQNSLAVLKSFKLNTAVTLKTLSEYRTQLANLEQSIRNSKK